MKHMLEIVGLKLKAKQKALMVLSCEDTSKQDYLRLLNFLKEQGASAFSKNVFAIPSLSDEFIQALSMEASFLLRNENILLFREINTNAGAVILAPVPSGSGVKIKTPAK